MIQVVTYSGKEVNYNMQGIEQYSLHDIRSLDEYEVNVIDLSNPLLWNNNRNDCTCIVRIDDFRSIRDMIRNSKISTTVILLPQNEIYNYYWDGTKFIHRKELKNMLKELSGYILSQIYPSFESVPLSYENTKSCIGDKVYEAALYFSNVNDAIIKSLKSNKPTVVKLGKIVASTLSIKNGTDLMPLLNEMGLIKNVEETPIWMSEITMFDDAKQNNKIIECEKKIIDLRQAINTSREILNDNTRLKSALYTNGDELVAVVFEILEEMLGCDLSGFVDKKKEDFLFEIEGTIFIGEIKGVNHNVKSQNVTQLDVHYQSYLDEHQDINEQSVKALLIINHQKCKPVSEREPIKDTQINLAKRNRSLIIDTYTLLILLEKYRIGSLTREQIFFMLRDTEGLLISAKVSGEL